MNLRFLQTFVVVAEAGSIARAAARLNVSQPAASRQILALESELGVPLFDRIGRRLHLTSEAEDLLRRSRHLLMEAELFGARARALKGGRTGILRIGATPMVIEATLAPFLSRYRQRHPEVDVHLVEDGGLRLPSRLEHGDVHLALVVPDARFGHRLLYPVYNVAVVSAKHRLRRHRALDVKNLADEPLLLLHRSFGSREWLEAACSVAHIRPRVVLESMAPHALLALAAAGYGVAVVPSTALVPSDLRAVPLVQREAPIGRWLTLAWDARRSLAPYAKDFIDELAGHCRRAYPGQRLAMGVRPLPKPKSANEGSSSP